MDTLSKHYTLKYGSIRAPTESLGSDIQKFDVPSPTGEMGLNRVWSMSARTYIKRAVTEVKRALGEVNQRLKTKVITPMSDKYRAELDASAELDTERITYFQGLIGVLRWIVELGRINIMVAVSMVSSNLMAPCEGHLEQCFHIFAYLDSHKNSTMVFDAAYRKIDEACFAISDWSQFYPDTAETVPPNIPRPRGKYVIVTVYCDANDVV
jgi:hypothetical protein